MTTASALERARRTFDQQAWGTAYELLRALDEESALEPADLERAARSAYLTGRDEDCFALYERAFHERSRHDDLDGAALDGFWLVFGLMNRGELARAGGWLARAREVIDDGRRDCAARGYLALPDALRTMMDGRPEDSVATFTDAREIGRRFAEHDLIALAGLGRGQALVATGRMSDGLAVLDEVMVGVTAGETSPVVTGIVYCAVIAACMQALDSRRAREWTAALDRWCRSQPDLVPFRGQCLVHRAQLMRMRGAWTEAQGQLRQALERFALTGHPAVGDALYEQAEIHRLRGDFDTAEQAFLEATRFGCDAQPGLALLRLSQGRIDAAAAGIRRALGEVDGRSRRARLLSAAVAIACETHDLAGARTAADELGELATEHDVAALTAMAAQARGAVLLAEGDAPAALSAARRAVLLWQELDMPYESAQARLVVGMACRGLGDADAAHMELDATRRTLEDLAATPDVARVDALTARVAAPVGCGLTVREVEVLRMLATGRTNRAIASELFLSDKTVARHVSNIFTKLGLASRSAATAYAYDHEIV